MNERSNMHTIKKALRFVPLLIALSVMPVAILLTPACMTTNQQEIAFETIGTLNEAATGAYRAYMSEVVDGRIKTNNVPQVAKAFDTFRAGAIVALDSVQMNTNALAPASLQMLRDDLVRVIEAAKR